MWKAGRFYRNKTVLVTGHTGFKGSWLVAWLQGLGARVVGYALPPAGPLEHFDATNAGDGVVSVVGDIRDSDHLLAVFREYMPDLVFHLAAQALVLRSYRHPVETYATNVMGTVHVLDAIRHTASVRAAVVITSDKCYENLARSRPMREDDPMGGADPYSSSKGCAELVVNAYRRSYFTRENRCAIASARAGNIIGGGDWSEDRLIPDIVKALLASEQIRLRNPYAVRPWQHVLDALHGYLLLCAQLWKAPHSAVGAWNFGPSHGTASPVYDLAERVVQRWGKGDLVVADSEPAHHELGALLIDAGKARRILGWTSMLTLDEAVALTVDWYRASASNPADAQQLTRSQINAFMTRLENQQIH